MRSNKDDSYAEDPKAKQAHALTTLLFSSSIALVSRAFEFDAALRYSISLRCSALFVYFTGVCFCSLINDKDDDD